MANVNGDWNGQWGTRKEMGDGTETGAEDQVWGTSQRKRQTRGRMRLPEGARQVEAKIPPFRPYYSVRRRGPLVGRALPLGWAPPPPQPRPPACSRPAAPRLTVI